MSSSRNRTTRGALLLASVASASWSPRGSATSLPHPSLSVVETSLLTTAKDTFNGHTEGFQAAVQWTGDRLEAGQADARAPHLVCTEYGRGREAISGLQQYLSPDAVRPLAHEACIFVTAAHDE
ncbi:unnamed protein product, partial [Scytosiphon promiscuus]